MPSFLQTTRAQIGVSFAASMLVVLILISYLTYSRVSGLLLGSAQNYSDEIASQATGRLDALLDQMDTITLQATMEPMIQNILTDLKARRPVSVDRQLALRTPLIRLSSLQNVIQNMDVYSLDRAVYPASNTLLADRIDRKWIEEADRNSGQLVWIGTDPQVSGSILGIRQVRLESDHYTKGGYILIDASSSLLDFLASTIAKMEGSAMYLLNANGEVVSSSQASEAEVPLELLHSSSDRVRLDGSEYKLIRQKANRGEWTLVLMMPMSRITSGVASLQELYWLVGIVAAGLFALLSFALSTLLTKPIRRLSRFMRSSRDGVFKTNPDLYFNREMNELTFSYNRMVSNINQLIDEVYKQEIANMNSEIKALHSQIHPHFLYNTLEAFYWSLIRKGEDELASKVLSLSNLFRYAIKQEKDKEGHLIDLRSELDHVASYMEIMTMRMGSRLRWDCDADPETWDVAVPKLILQPIVENAILHGIEPKIGEGEVRLKAGIDPDNGDLIVIISDTGVGLTVEEQFAINDKLKRGQPVGGKRTGIGLGNIHQRIRYFYGEPYGIELSSASGRGTSVELRLPGQEPKNNNDQGRGSHATD